MLMKIGQAGNDAADEAADFRLRKVDYAVIDARRNLSGVCGRSYRIFLELHLLHCHLWWLIMMGMLGAAKLLQVWCASTGQSSSSSSLECWKE